jgi:hypothetical protein
MSIMKCPECGADTYRTTVNVWKPCPHSWDEFPDGDCDCQFPLNNPSASEGPGTRYSVNVPACACCGWEKEVEV